MRNLILSVAAVALFATVASAGEAPYVEPSSRVDSSGQIIATERLAPVQVINPTQPVVVTIPAGTVITQQPGGVTVVQMPAAQVVQQPAQVVYVQPPQKTTTVFAVLAPEVRTYRGGQLVYSSTEYKSTTEVKTFGDRRFGGWFSNNEWNQRDQRTVMTGQGPVTVITHSSGGTIAGEVGGGIHMRSGMHNSDFWKKRDEEIRRWHP